MSGNVAIVVIVAIWLAAVLIIGGLASIGMGDTKWRK